MSTIPSIPAPPVRPALHLVPAPDPDHPPARRRSYALELDHAPEALERVLGQLRRRRCTVTDIAYAAPYTDGAAANLVLGIEAPETHAHLVGAWLSDIVAVLSVELIAA